MLISSGSRLSQDLLLSLPSDADTERVAALLRGIPALSEYQIRTYSQRSEQTFDVTRELSNYILLILVIAAIFAGIILRSAHESLFADLSNTLRIVEILGFARRRQMIIFALLYGLIVPLAFVSAIALSSGIIIAIHSIPAASDFVFLLPPIVFTLEIISLLIITSFAPVWIDRLGVRSVLYTKIPKKIRDILSAYISPSGIVLAIGIWGIIAIIFEQFLWSSLVTLSGLLLLLLLGLGLSYLYGNIYRLSRGLRYRYFPLFD